MSQEQNDNAIAIPDGHVFEHPDMPGTTFVVFGQLGFAYDGTRIHMRLVAPQKKTTKLSLAHENARRNLRQKAHMARRAAAVYT